MFTPPRFVVIDDKPEHLDAILDVFQELGAGCQGVTYDPEHGLDNRHLAGVRVLFVDLHLIDLAATTDETRHFAIIAGILEDGIRPTGGPFILVVWTEHDDLVTRLTTYLDDSLDRDKPFARPLAVVGLAKRRFIDLDTGEAQEGRAAGLRDAVEQAVDSQPQLTALVAWESDVQAAAGATLSALVDLVPDNAKNSTSFAGGLDEVLSRLARESVGPHHVATDPRAAIAAALAPMLADRIVNQEVSEAALAAWSQAVTWEGRDRLDSTRAGKVNRMLHVAVPPTEAIRPGAWGAVVEFPAAWWPDNEFLERFGTTPRQLLGANTRSTGTRVTDVARGSFESGPPVTTHRIERGRYCICLDWKSRMTCSGGRTIRAPFVYRRPNGRRPLCCSTPMLVHSSLPSTHDTRSA